MKARITISVIATLFAARALLYYKYAANYLMAGGQEIFWASFFISLALPSILIVTGIGLFLLKKWSRFTALLLFSLKIPFLLWIGANYALSLLDTLRPFFIKMLGITAIQIILYSFLIYILTRPKVKALFR